MSARDLVGNIASIASTNIPINTFLIVPPDRLPAPSDFLPETINKSIKIQKEDGPAVPALSLSCKAQVVVCISLTKR
jgi:hypothetical protein